MYFRQGNNWSLGVCANPQLLMALYLRELGGISPLDVGPNSALVQRAKPRPRQTPDSPGQIRQEWYSWWSSLVRDGKALNEQQGEDLLTELARQGYPELGKLANAHYGQTTLFAQEHVQDFTRRSQDYVPARMDEIESILAEHGIDHLKDSPAAHLQLVDVPLSDPRAWLAGNTTVVASSALLRDPTAFRGYLEPIVSIIFH
ncbi:hypothetical protein OK351_02185 [Glutamicibacter sp. MNS18]|uniref:hypothetical protein n=1 Tax=Glutamicibacter sp. MNS18 TaxID=2989817 RepID=UPI0022358910|nr:hypothetical protein [Glutamicibacter sp. MNS18]MCW4464320.1 hypothetical protein [Glutamicibacter sp. MNS18]